MWAAPRQPTWQQPQPGWQQQQPTWDGQSGWQQPQWGQQPGWQQPATGQPGWQQQPGWTPPPQPGLFPLRPMTFGILFGTPFKVLRHNPRATVGGALIVQLITTVASTALLGLTAAFAALRISTADRASTNDQQLIIAGSVALLVVATLVTLLISLAGTALVQGLVASEVSHGALGEKLTLRGLWRATRGRRWRLIGWTALLIGGLAAAIGLVVLFAVAAAAAGPVLATVLIGVFGGLGVVVLLVWISTKTALTPSAIVLEKTSVMVGIRRSWALTRQSFWKTFGILALVAVICSVASAVITFPLQIVYYIVIALISPTGSFQDGGAIGVTIGYYVLSLIVGTLIGSVTGVVQSATATTIYLDLRMRREGLDADLRRVVDARAAGQPDAGDPFATPAASPWPARPWGTPPGAGWTP